MSQRTACSNPVGAWFQFFHFHVNFLQPSAAGWPGSLCTAAHSQSELLKPGEAKQFNTLTDLHVSMTMAHGLRLMRRPLLNIKKSWHELESIPVKA